MGITEMEHWHGEGNSAKWQPKRPGWYKMKRGEDGELLVTDGTGEGFIFPKWKERIVLEFRMREMMESSKSGKNVSLIPDSWSKEDREDMAEMLIKALELNGYVVGGQRKRRTL